MFAFKKKYFLIIESIKDIDLRDIKKNNKLIIIYRNYNKNDDKIKLKKFRKNCKLKFIKFFVANNLKLAKEIKSDGIYLSSKNNSSRSKNLKKMNFEVIGSAHNITEIENKKKQGCNYIIFSRLFRVSYKPKMSFLGVNKFNYLTLNIKEKLIPLGGINFSNLNKQRMINSDGFAIMTAIKKKPANIINRLF